MLRVCLKSASSRPFRGLILIGIVCCCVVMLAIPTLFSPLNVASSDQNIRFFPENKQKKWSREKSEFDRGEQLVDIKRKFFGNGNILFGDKKSAMGLILKVPTHNSIESGVNLPNKHVNFTYKEHSSNNFNNTIHSNNSAQNVQNVQSFGTENRMRKSFRRRMFQRTYVSYVPAWRTGLYYNHSVPPPRFNWWTEKQERFCGRRLTVYSSEFAILLGVFVDRKYCTCDLKGGEYITSVLNQEETDEYYKIKPGCFQMSCNTWPTLQFNNYNNHLNVWMDSVATSRVRDRVTDVRAEFTIAITRYEYANLYHTMTDWYNAFLLMQYFNQTSHTTNILIVDSHPYGQLDSVWPRLFNSTIRLSALPQTTYFLKLVWGILGYNSPMKTHTSRYPPLYEEFREFVLRGYGIEPNNHTFDCERISILFIWRRDYIAHPRNPTGFVSRKIANEAKLLRYIQKHHPTFRVQGLQVDQYDMRIQLKHIVNTDILIGMHGAGLTHAAFLPRRAGLIELAPSYATANGEHFLAIARWRRLVYESWQNDDEELEEENESTNVPPQVLNKIIKRVVTRLCQPQVEEPIEVYDYHEDYDLPTRKVKESATPPTFAPEKRQKRTSTVSTTRLSFSTTNNLDVLIQKSQNITRIRKRRRLTTTTTTALPEIFAR